MARLFELLDYVNDLLAVKNYRDYTPNGLQVEGKHEIKKIVTGVSASYDLIEKAVEKKADAILVHHGYFWKNENPCILGMKKERLKLLLQHEINLIAYHIPLDDHPVYGNNIQLAKVLGIKVEGKIAGADDNSLVWHGVLAKPISAQELLDHIASKLNRTPVHLPGDKETIKTIAWCTGAAQGYIDQAVDANMDAYLSGEVSEQTYHVVKETGTHFFAGGHHATERYGVRSLGEHLAQKYSLDCDYIELDNPV